ncbi:MAG TPA: lamin tail domain-containing protein, partial [Nodosilinea sp.]|nr:lamin tail domain-containing protein [Nodosilinea sp.]
MAINLTGTTYVQDFDGLANSGTTSAILPEGWFFLETGTNANDTYGIGTGSNNAGNTYSFGAAGDGDRAFGGLLSGSLIPTIGASFANATGSTITGFNISYFGEQWRLGSAGREDRLDFQYSLNATALNTGTWIDLDALDFVAPVTIGTVGLRDGNAPENRTEVSGILDGLTIAPGETLWIRWSDFNAAAADDGLAVDDFTLVPLLAQTGVGNMQITEFMYQGANGEFVEFTNVGTAPVDLAGWSFDDDSRTPGSFDLSAFGVVQPGESVILTEASEAAFRAAWGLDASFKVIGGLSGGNNLGRADEVNLYDASGNLVDRLTYGDQTFPGTPRTQNISAWTGIDNLETQAINSGWVSSTVNNGQNARTSAGGDIASPGIFNTPTTVGAVLIETGGTTQVAEGGASDTYTLVLRSQPTADVVVTLDPGNQLTTNLATVTFTPNNWNIPQVITVTAVDDAIAEGDHTGTIAHSVVSADASFNGLGIRAVTAAIADNDAPPASTVGIAATDPNAAESGT